MARRCEECEGEPRMCGGCSRTSKREWYRENSNRERERARGRLYRKKNRGKNLERDRAYQKKRREKNREKIREQERAWRKKNPERVRERRRAYYNKNRKKLLEQARARNKKNPERVREWRRANYEKNREKILKQQHVWRRENRVKTMLKSAQTRARKKGLPFTLTDIEIPEVCPVLGIPLQPSDGQSTPGSPTIDRIDNTKGYTPDNVLVVSFRVNTVKNDATLEELQLLAEFYTDLAETRAILADEETMDDLRQAEEDLKSGNTVRGEDLRG